MTDRRWQSPIRRRRTRWALSLALPACAGTLLVLIVLACRAPQKLRTIVVPVVAENLAQVPEVLFQAPPAGNLSREEAVRHTEAAVARIHQLNNQKQDGFLLALRGERPDLEGLPFAMGDACRMKDKGKRPFTEAVAQVRQAALLTGRMPRPMTKFGARNAAETFWDRFEAGGLRPGRWLADSDGEEQDHVALAHLAALTQMLAPETPAVRLGLVRYLSQVSHAEATKALARLVVFSAEDEVRQAALKALKVRRERDYTDVLLAGLRYPWPVIAGRTADALVKLERQDLVPQLVDLLEEPDPRLPVVQEIDSKKVTVVRELVRVNHHKNCLLCHPPADRRSSDSQELTAAIPIPTDPLPSPGEGYRNRPSPGVLLMRFDVTYLRQDFSVLQEVKDADPWPKMQRFDFLVRTRIVTDDEAEGYRVTFGTSDPEQPSPYRHAAWTALRGLTGKDAEPTAKAWRRLLELPAKGRLAMAR